MLRYNENGHVTKPWNSPSKPTPGLIWVYGTEQPTPQDTLSSIYGVWQAGNSTSPGSLLGVFPFDDGSCYQYSTDSPVALQREEAHPTTPRGDTLLCNITVNLPTTIQGNVYTMYWVWEYFSSDGTPDLYTSCLDLNIDE